MQTKKGKKQEGGKSPGKDDGNKGAVKLFIQGEKGQERGVEHGGS